MIRRTVVAALLGSLLLTVAPVSAGPEAGIEGSWDLAMRRPAGAIPRTCLAALDLRRRGDGWTGVIRFRRILAHKTIPLADVVVTRKGFEADLRTSDAKISIRGDLKDGLLKGFLEWEGYDTFGWTACRPGLLFEPGLQYRGNLLRGEARKAGLEPEALSRLVVEARDAYTDSLLILKNGRVVCERTFGHPPGPIHTMSVTKFVTAIGIAFLLDEKKIESLDAPLSTWYPEWKEDPHAKVTLRHVLTHTSGIHHEENAEKLNQAEDRVAYALAHPMDKEPGKVHSYNNDAVALLSGIFPKVVGKPMDEYLGAKLFRPLKVEDWTWNRDKSGTTVAYAELAMTARELARVGRFVSRGGKAFRTPLLAEKWIAALGSPATDAKPDQGLLWRLILDGDEVVGVYHTGWLGQWIVVMPKERLVAVRLRRFEDQREVQETKYEFGRFLGLLRASLR